MLIGNLPPASNRATWIEAVELRDASDDSLIDWSVAEEITLKLRDPQSKTEVLTLTLSDGEITLPSIGIIQFRAEVGQMRGLEAKSYEVAMEVEDGDDTISLLLGWLPVMGW